MSNTSATGGFLTPLNDVAPLEDAALANFMQQLVSGITGIDPTLVRPRWQQTPPVIPNIAINWCAIGVQSRTADVNAFETHDGVNNWNVVIRHEELAILCSFYGPNADNNASLLRDGLSVAQNREALQLVGMGLISLEDAVAVPSQVNDQWYYRVDMMMNVRRVIERHYQVLNILTSGIVLETDTGITDNIGVHQ